MDADSLVSDKEEDEDQVKIPNFNADNFEHLDDSRRMKSKNTNPKKLHSLEASSLSLKNLSNNAPEGPIMAREKQMMPKLNLLS